MHRLVSPLCLLLALAMVIVGFALLAVDPPQPSTQLHKARAAGDDAYGDAIEAAVRRRRWTRKALLVCLFVGAGIFTVTAFACLRVDRRLSQTD